MNLVLVYLVLNCLMASLMIFIISLIGIIILMRLLGWLGVLVHSFSRIQMQHLRYFSLMRVLISLFAARS